MEFSYRDFENEFACAMEELEQAFRERDHLKTISYLRFLTRAYYTLNYKLSDDRLEGITHQISLDLLGETLITNSKENTVVFYDGFGYIRGYAGIYVTALAQLGYQVVWIMQANAKDPEEIQKKYASQKNVSFRIVPKAPILERMRLLRDIIREVAPRHLFIFALPFHVGGIGAISTVGGDVTRYMLDMGDHAFWLGKCALDYVIGFRNFGYNVAVQYRNIAPERIVIHPYYPEPRTYSFEGMPFDTEKCEYFFSGGSAYKIEGDDDNTYQKMVEYILTHYPEMKFVFASYETNSVLDYLKETYQGQFFHIDERRDLDEVLKRAKLYLGTYPIGGALMTQYALKNGCIPLCLDQDSDSRLDPTSSLFLKPDKVTFKFCKKEALLSELDRLLKDKRYYEEVKKNLDGQVITEKEFAEELQRIMTEHTTKFSKKDTPVNLEHFLEIYRKRANYDLFCDIVYNSHNDWIKRKYPSIIEEMDAKRRDIVI